MLIKTDNMASKDNSMEIVVKNYSGSGRNAYPTDLEESLLLL
jgi:hypothetical protein